MLRAEEEADVPTAEADLTTVSVVVLLDGGMASDFTAWEMVALYREDFAFHAVNRVGS